MGTLATTNIKHASSTSNNIILSSDGSTNIPNFYYAGMVLEKIAGACDGRTVTGRSGNYTLENVTQLQTATTSYQDVTGSEISYTPPSNTKVVIYEFHYSATREGSQQTLYHMKFLIDGVEASKYRQDVFELYGSGFTTVRYVIDCNSSSSDASTDSARFTSWTSAKTLKLSIRDYDSSNNGVNLHTTRYWDGATAAHLVVPNLTIEAIA